VTILKKKKKPFSPLPKPGRNVLGTILTYIYKARKAFQEQALRLSSPGMGKIIK
jgi:hypothetical protein